MSLTDDQILHIIMNAAHAAGDRALESYGAITTSLKHDGSTVTEADQAAEEYLRGVIAEHLPGHRVLGEEGGGDEDICEGPVWLIDPIDGTNNFVHGIPLWGVSIGLVRDGRPAIGVIYFPVLDETYWAIAGGGAFRDGIPLHADDKAEIEANDLFGFTTNAWDEFNISVPTKARALGSAAACCAYAASGAFVGTLLHDVKVWDIGAGLGIALEAGCVAVNLFGERVTSFHGMPAGTKVQPLVIAGPRLWASTPGYFARRQCQP